MTLRTRLTAAFLAVVLAPVLVGAALVLGLFPHTARELQGRGLTSGAGLAVAAVTERCLRLETAAEAVAQAAGSGQAALATAVDRLAQSGTVSGVRVVGLGVPPAAWGQAPDPAAQDCRDGRVDRSGSRVQLVVRLPVALAPRAPAPVREPDAHVLVAVAVDDAYAEALRAAAGVDGLVLLDDGRPVAATHPLAAGDLARVLGTDGAVLVGRRVAVALTFADQPLDVVVLQERGWRTASPWLLVPALVATAGVLAIAIGSGLARVLARPLEELGEAASRVAEGDLTPTLQVRSRDEVGRLAEAFNVMTERLAVQVAALEDSREQLRAGVSRLGSALAGTHDLDRLLAVVLETAVASVRAGGGAVLLQDASSGELVLSVGRGLAARGVPEGLRLAQGEGVSGTVARTGAPLRGRTGTGPGQLAPAGGEPVDAPLVAVPLSGSAGAVGVLLLWDRSGDEAHGGADADFTEQDVTTLQAFTAQATVAVDNVLLHDELRRQSVTDGLTGVANFRAFTDRVGREIERAARFRRPLALLLLDLDRFKLVNDVHGHLRGDAVLVELAARLRGQVRDVDMLARYGGEEFVVVLPETGRDGAVQAADRICAAVRGRPFGGPGEPPLGATVSIGIAVFPDHGTSSPDLLRRADGAMYDAKRAGRDGWRLAGAEAPAASAPSAPAARGGSSVGSPP